MLEIKQAILKLNRHLSVPWVMQNNQLHKKFIFSNFVEAFGWMSQVALLAEKIDHHPEMINTYNQVIINLSTHDVNRISEKDFRLAEKIEKISQ